MQRLEVSGAVRPLQGSLGVEGLILYYVYEHIVVPLFKKEKKVNK